MKKLTLILLSILMIVTLAACGGLTQDDIDNAVSEATAPLNSQITALEADIADKEAKIDSLEGEKATLTAEKTELLADIEEIEAEVATLEATKAALEQEKASLIADKVTLEASITAKDNEIATINSSLSALETEKASLTARVGELEASIADKNTEIATLNSSIATLTAQKQALTDKVAELEAKNEVLESQNAELEGRISCFEGNHAFEVSYEWADDYTACTATQFCKRETCDVENQFASTSITISGTTLTAAFDSIANAEIDVSAIENKDYIVATGENNNTTYVAYTEADLLAWNAYAQTNTATNLVLGKDITLTLADGATSNWTSVGTETTPYTGTVDGNGYSITGLTINQTGDNAGFIGYLDGGTIKNLTMKGLSVSNTGNNTGGLVGYKTGGAIEFCRVESGTVNGTTNVGGLVGLQYKGDIIACSNAANVNGSYYLGGIAGTLSSTAGGGYVIGCNNSGAIKILTDGWDSGGIGGYSLYGTIKGCYNTASGGNYAIVGWNTVFGPFYSSSNYWSSSHSAAYGSSIEGDTENSGCTKIENTSTAWEGAASAMNTELESYGYRYVVNTDTATSSTEPLIIEKITG